MSKRTAYFSNGEIMECDCGKSAFRRHIRLHLQYEDEPVKVWFHECDAWKDATEASLNKWARDRGFASYKGYTFLMNILAK